MMRLSIACLPFLVLLAYAATGDDDFCTQFLGQGINFNDCYEAFKNVPVTEPSDLPGMAVTRARLFSSAPNTPPRFKLPQSWTSGQCIIEISMAAGVDYAATLWDFQRKAVKKILDYCVQPHGIGGRVMLQATTIEVRSAKKKMKPNQQAAGDKCLALPVESAAYQCLKDAEHAAFAANIALGDFSDHLSTLTYEIANGLIDSR